MKNQSRLAFYLIPPYHISKDIAEIHSILQKQYGLSAAARFQVHCTIKGFFKPNKRTTEALINDLDTFLICQNPIQVEFNGCMTRPISIVMRMDEINGAANQHLLDFRESIVNIIMPYIIPQEFGNHTDVRWAAVTHESGKGLLFTSNHLMNVSINPYFNLESAWYPYQLKRKENIILNIDHRVSGVGGTPITVRHAYRTYPDEYQYRVRIKPFDSSQTDLLELGRE